MKLSFSLTAKSKKPSSSTTTATSAFESSSSSKPNPQTSKHFVTQFDPSSPPSQTLIIPPKPNEYRPFKPSGPNPLQFELESDSTGPDPGPDSILYGLNVRESNVSNPSNGVVAARGGDPMLVKYKEDIERLPEVEGFDEFEDMPVEGFGAALLAGYGWKEGMGIGRNAKEDVKIVEYKKWSGKEGLGFDIEAPESRDRVNGKGDKKYLNARDEVRVNGKARGEELKDSRKRRGREEEEPEEERGRERRNGTRENLSTRNDGDGRDEELKDIRKRRGREKDVEEESEEERGRDGSSSSRERRDERRENSSRRSGRDGRDEESKDSSRKKRRGREDDEEQSEDERRGKTRENGSSSRRNHRDDRDELKDSRKRERRHRVSDDVENQSDDARLEAGEVDDRDGSSSRERRDKTRENGSSSRRDDRGRRDEASKHSRKKGKKHKRSEDVEKQSEDVRLDAGEVDGRDGSSSRERRDKTREDVSSSRRDNRGRRDEESKHSRKKEKKHKRSEDVGKQSEVVRERGSEQSNKSEKVIWLFSHIRVRVISKAVKGGQLYLKKGEVVDVAGPSCDILMDESRELVQGVGQEYLETALPKRGGPVLVLFGKHKGVYGRLMEKDTDKETGLVQDADNHEMLNVRLEQIAEFVGDPSYIGY